MKNFFGYLVDALGAPLKQSLLSAAQMLQNLTGFAVFNAAGELIDPQGSPVTISTLGADTQGTASAYTVVKKLITGIQDGALTAAFTVTIPNGSHSAMVRIDGFAVAGAGGDIGAGESIDAAGVAKAWIFTRTPGVSAEYSANTMGAIGAATVTGGNAITMALDDEGSIQGSSSGVNTLELQISVSRALGTANNHVAFLTATVFNLNADGITVA